MIVHPDGDSLLLITQPDHAGLAADLMAAWKADGLPTRASREAVLFATRHHNIGWTSGDARPTLDPEGRPYDFVLGPHAERQAVWPRAVDVLAHRSTYAAALVAQHAVAIYRRFRQDAAWAGFFDTMEAARDAWFTTDERTHPAEPGPDVPVDARRTFLQDYAALRTGDLMSLIVCQGQTAPEWAEGYRIELAGAELIVSPDPFEEARVPFEVRARRIPDRRYRSDEDLQTTLAAAHDVWLRGTAVGQTG